MWKATWAMLFGASLMLVGCGETSEPGGPGANGTNGANGANGEDGTQTTDGGQAATAGDEENTFTITVPGDLTLTQGEAGNLEVTVDRGDKFNQPVDITLEGLPAGVEAQQPTQTVAANQDKVNFALTVAPDAKPVQDAEVMVRGEPETGKPVEQPVPVTIEQSEAQPPETQPQETQPQGM